MPAKVYWNDAVQRMYTDVIPQQAFDIAAIEAARVASAAAGGGPGIGADLGRPKPLGPLHALLASSKPWAGIQQWGGTIRPRRPGGRLLIGANRGEITASAESIHIKGKHFLEPAHETFKRALVSNLKRLIPG